MHIICCVKQVPDPETPASAFKIDTEAKRAVPAPGIAPVMSPFDEQAVEVALRLKDKYDAKVTIISVGPPSVRETVKHGIAMGADEGIVVTDAAFEVVHDPTVTAKALAAAIKKLGDFDLIMCGRQAADYDNGQVGLGVAALLGIPALINGQNADVADGRVRFERVLPEGIAIYEAPTPAVLTYSQEVGQPRYPTLKNIMAAAKKELTVWNTQDLGLDTAALEPRTKMLKLYIPVFEGQCEFIEEDTAEETGRKLALKLREAKII